MAIGRGGVFLPSAPMLQRFAQYGELYFSGGPLYLLRRIVYPQQVF
jgi:hypothetical protein